jgi:hypothetical protein
MKRLLAAMTAALLMLGLVSGAAFAAKPPAPGPGNSLSAKACQKGGYVNLIGSTGQIFATQDACVSYAAKGGVLSPKLAAPTIDVSVCEYITFNVTQNSPLGWYAVATGGAGTPFKWGPLNDGTDNNTKQIGPGTYSVSFYLGDPAAGGVLASKLGGVVITACGST